MIYYINCMLFLFCIVLLGLLYSCTTNISMANTEGPASDIIDDNQAANPQVTATMPELI